MKTFKNLSKKTRVAILVAILVILAGAITIGVTGCTTNDKPSQKVEVTAPADEQVADINVKIIAEGWTKDSTPTTMRVFKESDNVETGLAIKTLTIQADKANTESIELPVGNYLVTFTSPVNTDGSKYDTGKPIELTVKAADANTPQVLEVEFKLIAADADPADAKDDDTATTEPTGSTGGTSGNTGSTGTTGGNTGTTGGTTGNSGSTGGNTGGTTNPPAAHVHTWVDIVVHHPAVAATGHNVHHEAVTHDVIIYWTGDGQRFTNKNDMWAWLDDHDTNYGWYHETVVDQAAYDEWVQDSPAKAAWDEVTGQKCTTCGATK